MSETYTSFREFYPFYLSEHRNRTCRRLHFAGSAIGIACVAMAIATANAWFILLGLVLGYGLAWAGHFFFEKNRPTTFRYPVYSFVGDWAMFRDILVRRIEF